MAEKNRLRKKKNLTLNPDGVEKMIQYGMAQSVPETNLSRLIDLAVVEFLKKHWRPEYSKLKTPK